MKRPWLLIALFLALACVFTNARAQDLTRAPNENDLSFAKRALHLPDDADPHTTATTWNGRPTLFVDYQTSGDDPERPLVAFQQQPTGEYREIQVTVGEQEGGTPDISALGFANANHDPAKQLIVILAWPQRHAEVEGTLYEVRIFDDPKPGQHALTLLNISQKFGSGCDCQWSDGKSKHYRFKTIAAVKNELKRLGY
ncbi:MAG TPA: hypothetical protein VIZ17_10885 [Acetobacteraceae bacterium]